MPIIIELSRTSFFLTRHMGLIENDTYRTMTIDFSSSSSHFQASWEGWLSSTRLLGHFRDFLLGLEMNVIKESIAFCKVLCPIKKFDYPTRRLKLTGRYQKSFDLVRHFRIQSLVCKCKYCPPYGFLKLTFYSSISFYQQYSAKARSLFVEQWVQIIRRIQLVKKENTQEGGLGQWPQMNLSVKMTLGRWKYLQCGQASALQWCIRNYVHPFLYFVRPVSSCSSWEARQRRSCSAYH